MPETEDLGQIPQQLTKNTSATLTSSLLDDNNMIDQEFKEDQVQEQARQQSAPISPTTQKARESEPMEMPVNPAINQEKPGQVSDHSTGADQPCRHSAASAATAAASAAAARTSSQPDHYAVFNTEMIDASSVLCAA
jgi:hypothetical protein